MNKNKLAIFSILMVTAACEYQSGSGNYNIKRPYTQPPRDLPYSGWEHKYAYYPTYDPEADNPYRPFGMERYVDAYPHYNPDDDNPYYPPEVFIMPDSKAQKIYIYPKYDPEADNPPYIPRGKQMFNAPLFETPKKY